MKKKAITRLDDCQYLLVSQTNDTLTNYAEHHPESISHDRIIKDICIVNCIYVNPKTEQYWLIDYRIDDKTTDGKSKLDHLKDMLQHSIEHKQIKFNYVLMDTWYATKDIMLYIDNLQKIYYCPLKSNRKVDDSKGVNPYKAVNELTWTDQEQNGKLIKIHAFSKDYKVQLLWVVVNENRTDWIVTNDTT